MLTFIIFLRNKYIKACLYYLWVKEEVRYFVMVNRPPFPLFCKHLLVMLTTLGVINFFHALSFLVIQALLYLTINNKIFYISAKCLAICKQGFSRGAASGGSAF